MTNLYDLADLPCPASHRHDPATSREAASNHKLSGKQARHARIVLALVERFPRRTAIELFDVAGESDRDELKEPQEVRRRLCDLERAGLVRKCAARTCGVRGTTMVTWEVVR